MTDDDLRKIVAETVAETLIALGIDAKNPKEMQADMQHLRSWRQSVNAVKRQSLVTVVGVITTGLLGLVWVAITRQD